MASPCELPAVTIDGLVVLAQKVNKSQMYEDVRNEIFQTFQGCVNT